MQLRKPNLRLLALGVLTLAFGWAGVRAIEWHAQLLRRNVQLEKDQAVLVYQLNAERFCSPRSFCMLRQFQSEQDMNERLAELRAQFALQISQLSRPSGLQASNGSRRATCAGVAVQGRPERDR